MCYRCCATWGETVIKIQCDETRVRTNATRVGSIGQESSDAVEGNEKGAGRELGFS